MSYTDYERPFFSFVTHLCGLSITKLNECDGPPLSEYTMSYLFILMVLYICTDCIIS